MRRTVDGVVEADNELVSMVLERPVRTVEPPRPNDPRERRTVLNEMLRRLEGTAAGQANRQRMLNDLVLLAVADIT